MRITESKLRKIIRQELSNLTEASKVDVRYAVKRMREYNRGIISWDEMVQNIIDDLGYDRTNKRIRDAVSDHLYASSKNMRGEELPLDQDIIRELYDIIERVK